MKEKLKKIAQAFGFTSKISEDKMTTADWQKFEEAFQKEYGASFSEALADQKKLQKVEAERDSIKAILGVDEATSDSDPGKQNIPLDQKVQQIIDENKQKEAALADREKKLEEKEAAIKKMAEESKPDKPTSIVPAIMSVNGPGTTADHFLGIEHPLFSMKNRWNKVAANPGIASLSEPSIEDDASFKKEVVNYSQSLAERYKYLKANNLLTKVAAGEFDFDTANVANVSDQYITRRQDMLIGRMLKFRSVTDIFPVRYGVQDRDVLFNAFISEVSQAYQEGEIFKGSMDIDPEIGYVDDAMAKVRFGPLKKIERLFIGYLNKEGSDPIKWTMIEFALLMIYEKLFNEQNQRRIWGIYVKPENGVAGSYRNAGTGYIYCMARLIHENKLLPHDDKAYNDYTEATFLDAINAYLSDVKSTLDEDQNLDGYTLKLNENHRTWFITNVREKYGKDFDFKDIKGSEKVPDYDVSIEWVPNMGQSKLMLLSVPGNLQCIEFIPGEMLSVQIDRQMELVLAWSTWKEGFGAEYVGRHFNSFEELEANHYAMQQIFCNKPCVEVEANATELPATNFWLVTPSNTQDTAIIDITQAKKGVAYIIECGGTEKASTIAKAGKFADISKAYTPVKKGDYIMVILNSKGNFLELERCVNGIRTINSALQPNIPGAQR